MYHNFARDPFASQFLSSMLNINLISNIGVCGKSPPPLFFPPLFPILHVHVPILGSQNHLKKIKHKARTGTCM